MNYRLVRALAGSCALLLAGAALAADPPAAAPTTVIPARVQTEASRSGEVNSSALLLDARDPAKSRILSSAALGGIERHDLSGKLLGESAGGEVASVDVGYDVVLGKTRATVIAAIDTTDNRLRLYAQQGSEISEISARTIALGFAAEGVCLWRNGLDGALYAFIIGDGGEVDQQLLYATAASKLDARQVRRIQVPSPLKQCVAAADGTVYASEESVGIWRFNADPESDVSAALVDAPGLGKLGEEVGGLAVYDGGDGSRWLLASDVAEGRINVYDRSRAHAYIGSFAVAAPGATVAIKEPGPLFATSMALGKPFAAGALLVTDEDAANYKLLAFADIAAALKLAPGVATDPRTLAASKLPAVMATVQTVSVGSYGDAADDPAIWTHPTDPARSLVVATDKKAGLYLYDMQGQVLQFLPVGKVNNVDLREGFALGGDKVVLVTASNRTDKSISILRLDTVKRQLVDVADGIQPTGLTDPYGLCMYRSAKNGDTYVFINSGDGPLKQWRLSDAGNGRIKAQLVRELRFETQTEGCVAHDAAGTLYIGEEDIALWKLDAEPDGGAAKAAVDRVADHPAIKDDLEGVGIYDLGNGRGYIVVSSQGNDSYAVYRLEGSNAYVGSFAVVADAALGIDGISETDGLEVSSRNLGPGFESGAMIAQDGRKLMPTANQNYKYVPWSSIAKALKLESRKN